MNYFHLSNKTNKALVIIIKLTIRETVNYSYMGKRDNDYEPFTT